MIGMHFRGVAFRGYVHRAIRKEWALGETLRKIGRKSKENQLYVVHIHIYFPWNGCVCRLLVIIFVPADGLRISEWINCKEVFFDGNLAELHFPQDWTNWGWFTRKSDSVVQSVREWAREFILLFILFFLRSFLQEAAADSARNGSTAASECSDSLLTITLDKASFGARLASPDSFTTMLCSGPCTSAEVSTVTLSNHNWLIICLRETLKNWFSRMPGRSR